MIKPDGVQRGLVGKIIVRFEAKGFKMVAIKTEEPSRELLEEHYADLKVCSSPTLSPLLGPRPSFPLVATLSLPVDLAAGGRPRQRSSSLR